MYPNTLASTRQATAPPRSKKKTVYTLALRRLADIRNLLWWRLSVGIAIPTPEEIICLAGPSIHALAGMKEWFPHRETQRKHDGLDLARAVDFIASIYRGFVPVDRQEIEAELLDAMRAYDWRPDPEQPFTPSAAYAGHALAVTRDERENLELWTMEAVDEPAEARKARKAAEKREADRLRQRAKRRMAAAREARITGGPTLEDQAPWLALGISRRTYFRRKKAGDLSAEMPAKRNGFERGTEPSRTSIQKERGARHKSVTDPIASPSIDNSSAPAKARRAKRPRIEAHSVADFSIPLSPEDFPDDSHTEADFAIPLSIEDFPDNVISLAAFRRDVRRACFARSAKLLEEGRVMLREQSVRLDREHAEREAGAVQGRPADDQEGAA